MPEYLGTPRSTLMALQDIENRWTSPVWQASLLRLFVLLCPVAAAAGAAIGAARFFLA